MIKKFFIHIPKNGGMTLRYSQLIRPKIELAQPHNHINSMYTNEVKKKMDSIGDHEGYEHARYRDIRKDLRDSLVFFAIVRNPWARVVSRYMFAKKVIEVEKKEPIGKHRIDSFESFLEERHEWGNQKYLWHRAIRGWYPAWDYVTDEKGILRCDIIRFDKYEQDIQKYFNVPYMTRPRNVTNILSGSNHENYKDLYNEKTIKIVADWYKKDIDFWGFDFDTGATKNTWSTE